MKQTLITKALAGSAAAMLLLPTIALAHDGGDNKGTDSLRVRIENRLQIAERGDNDRDEHVTRTASTTASQIAKKAARIQTAADTMLSFNSRLNALIASSSADSKAKLNAKLSAFQTAAANAKIEAGKAIVGAAQASSTTSTTTQASLLAAAKVDLRDAKNFLHDAKVAFFSLLRMLTHND